MGECMILGRADLSLGWCSHAKFVVVLLDSLARSVLACVDMIYRALHFQIVRPMKDAETAEKSLGWHVFQFLDISTTQMEKASRNTEHRRGRAGQAAPRQQRCMASTGRTAPERGQQQQQQQQQTHGEDEKKKS